MLLGMDGIVESMVRLLDVFVSRRLFANQLRYACSLTFFCAPDYSAAFHLRCGAVRGVLVFDGAAVEGRGSCFVQVAGLSGGRRADPGGVALRGF